MRGNPYFSEALVGATEDVINSNGFCTVNFNGNTINWYSGFQNYGSSFAESQFNLVPSNISTNEERYTYYYYVAIG